jgi:anti-sigma B factor antagonist
MDLEIEWLTDDVTKVVPIGRWDATGAGEIEPRLGAIAGSGRSLVIDMTRVSFLSSMGIRSIVISAKTVALKHAKLVLLSPERNVETVLTTTGIDAVAPIFHEIDAALAAVAG